MPSCVEPPSGTCKNKSKPKVVKFGQGELWLFEECEEIRFGHLNGDFTRRVSTKNPKKSSAGRKSTNPTANGSNRRSLRNTGNSNAEIAQYDLGTVNCKECENILVVDDDDSVSCDRCEQVLCSDCSMLTKIDIDYLAVLGQHVLVLHHMQGSSNLSGQGWQTSWGKMQRVPWIIWKETEGRSWA